jgi:hypothetical protein
MMMSPQRLALTVKCLMIFAIASSALASAGCGGDNPSSLAGTIELPDKKIAPPPVLKSPAKNKANPKKSNR